VELLDPRRAAIDVHERTADAAVARADETGRHHREVRTFATTTGDLERLGAWPAEHSVTRVAMESTGVCSKPHFDVLEERFVVVLADAVHVKAVPGRETDVRDCEWLAELLQHGLLRASLVPDRARRERRARARYRTSPVRGRTAEANRLQKTLEGANIELDIPGKSGRAMLAALVAGEMDAATPTQLAGGRFREKLSRLEQALTGRFGGYRRFKSELGAGAYFEACCGGGDAIGRAMAGAPVTARQVAKRVAPVPR
jgi:transposase